MDAPTPELTVTTLEEAKYWAGVCALAQYQYQKANQGRLHRALEETWALVLMQGFMLLGSSDGSTE